MTLVSVFRGVDFVTNFTGISTGDNMRGLNMLPQSTSNIGLISTCETLPPPSVLALAHLVLNVVVELLCNKVKVTMSLTACGIVDYDEQKS